MLSFVSCEDESEISTVTTNQLVQQDTSVIQVDNLSKNSFSEGIEQSLLVEVGMCDTLIDGFKLPCTPTFFRFFPLKKNKPIKEGFILLVNSRGFNDSKSFFIQRRVFVFERVKGQLVEVNKFKANIVEIRTPKLDGYNEILLRFRDSRKNIFYCSYRWNNEKFELFKCEEIAEFGDRAPRKVKKELIDSVSIEIGDLLKEEGLAF